MSYLAELSLEYDPGTRIAELSAKKVLEINTADKLETLCNETGKLLFEATKGERCYMAVDISKIAIEPGLSLEYSKKIKFLRENFLYPDGLVRYGFEITRITIKLAGLKSGELPILFNKREEAIIYLQELSEKHKEGAVSR